MKLSLDKISRVTHGTVLNRIKLKNPEEGVIYPVLSISQLLEEEDGLLERDIPEVYVKKEKVDSLNLAKRHSVVIGLTSFHKAAVLEKHHEGKIIPSNFVSLEFVNGIMDPYYFAWYFNEHPEMQRQKEMAIQGNSSVKVLSIQMIRKFVMECPDLSTQMSIGKLYYYQQKRHRLLLEKIRLEEEVLTEELIRQLRGDEVC